MGNAHQGAKAPQLNNSHAPKKMKLKLGGSVSLLARRPVQEGKRSLFNSNAIVGMRVSKVTRVYKKKSKQSANYNYEATAAQKPTKNAPKIKYKRRSSKISARDASAKSSAARREGRHMQTASFCKTFPPVEIKGVKISVNCSAQK
ncbi:hypothetical protein TRVL_09634 [Trypanosoma vivax]|nr:hypothetical protein TRVL_09634 [Trypanosoma vivax]